MSRSKEVDSSIETDSIYLEIAKHAHRRMNHYRNRVRLGSQRFYPREQMAHAAVCIVFSAFAVEHGIKRLLHARLYLESYGERHKKMMAEMPKRKRGRLRRQFAFVRRYSQVSRPLLRDARRIFRYRNELAHSKTKGKVTVEGTEETRGVKFHVLDREILDVATRCLDIAARTVPALREAHLEKGWNPFGC